ncbi:MAG: hypothetical protein K6F82_03430 [Sphaerochaetaceae bacterium]|nr:hypothetical protein [Sphaerochaetaceae bacterium]
MESIIKTLILVLFAVVIFARQYFPSDALYWGTYCFMFVLVVLLWTTSYWVSKKKAASIMGRKGDFDIFCGKVLPDVNADLQRGRLVFMDGEVTLITKTKGKYSKAWSMKIEDITSVGFGTVVGWRKGFSLHAGEETVSFTSVAINKHRKELYNALGWNIKES